jgi:hypothetical protein
MKKNVIKLNTKTLSVAAYKAGTTMEEFVSQIRSLSLGRKVCAHFLYVEGDSAFFSVD